MKIDKAIVAKVGSMALAVGLLVGNAIKDMLDKREQEELINKLIDDKLNERERMGDDPEDEETEEDSESEDEESEEDEET